jgi:RNA polymerase sigma-70 factor (ECF subfamily)
MAETILPLDDEEASDAALAGYARRGSAAAFSVLVTRHCQAVYAIARNMVASSHDAAEITQQTFVSLHRDLLLQPGTTPFTTCLYRIAIKTALTRRHLHGRSPAGSLESFLPRFDREGRLVASTGRWPMDESGSPERVEITAALREALEFMDDGIRSAFVLRDLLELPVDEVAAVLETSSAAVRRRAHRARLMVRGLLDRLL